VESPRLMIEKPSVSNHKLLNIREFTLLKNLMNVGVWESFCFVESNLTQHQNVHTGEKSHEWKECKIAFICGANSTKPQNDHVDKKSFQMREMWEGWSSHLAWHQQKT
jgi:hypothetical protein